MYNLLNQNVNWYQCIRGHEKYSGKHFLCYLWNWLLEVGGGGVDVKFWTFDRQEKATKIEQMQIWEKVWSFGDNVITECPLPPPMKRCLLFEKPKDSSKVSASVQSQTDSSG